MICQVRTVRDCLCQTAVMDLDLFLADLSGKFDAERRADLDAIVDELTDAERARVSLAARLVAMAHHDLTVLLRGGERVSGTVVDVARTWVLVGASVGASLIPIDAIVAVWPLGGVAVDESSVANSVGIGHVLRELGASGREIVVDHDAGVHQGIVAAVMADHVDLLGAGGGMGVDARDHVGATMLTLSLQGVRRIRLVGSHQ